MFFLVFQNYWWKRRRKSVKWAQKLLNSWLALDLLSLYNASRPRPWPAWPTMAVPTVPPLCPSTCQLLLTSRLSIRESWPALASRTSRKSWAAFSVAPATPRPMATATWINFSSSLLLHSSLLCLNYHFCPLVLYYTNITRRKQLNLPIFLLFSDGYHESLAATTRIMIDHKLQCKITTYFFSILSYFFLQVAYFPVVSLICDIVFSSLWPFMKNTWNLWKYHTHTPLTCHFPPP